MARAGRTARTQDVISDMYNFHATGELWGVSYSGRSWGEPVYFPNSTGRLDVRSGFAVAPDGGIVVAWPTDNRDWSDMPAELADIYVGKVAAIPTAIGHALRPRTQPEITVYPLHPNEVEGMRRIRDYEIKSGGKTYRIYHGDTHRHTEFSMDGYNDGSLLQGYRYALDAASLDFYANSEHNYLGGLMSSTTTSSCSSSRTTLIFRGVSCPCLPTGGASVIPTGTETSSSPTVE